MKHVYIDSRLRMLALAAREGVLPRNWVFSKGRPWLLVTPERLERLAAMLRPGDRRVDGIRNRIRRECARADAGGEYPLAICPVCDSVHRPHPMDANLACGACQKREERRRLAAPTALREEDMRTDAAAREAFAENFPESYMDGELSPNWRFNYERRLERDWEAAVNRILMGETYRRVARAFECSVGTLHKKVGERKHWESN